MSKKLPIVAIIGQTNAGKSALFNRIVGTQDAIVAREAGTTRDSVVRTVYFDGDKTFSRDDMRDKSEQRNKTHSKMRRMSSGTINKADRSVNSFVLVDTAGLKNPEDEFEATIQDQIDDAIDTADVILLVKDRTEIATQSDRNIAKKALKSKKPVILVLNKSDLKEKLPIEEFLRLGIKNIIEASAEHNQGVKEIIKEIAKSIDITISDIPAGRRGLSDEPRDDGREERVRDGNIGDLAKDEPDFSSKDLMPNEIKIALIGRPNVGKSHLFNTLAGKQQAIVADVAGTTRDINRVTVKYKGQNIELLDTAGVRRKGKIEQGVEKFSILRTVSAIEEADVCLLLMDVNELNTSVDQSLAGMISDAGKGLIIVVSKWDSVEGKDAYTRDNLAPQIAHSFDFVPWAPLIFTSSVTGQNVSKIFELATAIANRRQQQIPTRKLNKVLQQAVLNHPPAGLKNTMPKMRYMVQTDINPPWFVIYGANFKHIHWSYKRYLERQMRENFDLIGTPIRFSFRDEKQIKANREKEK